MKKFHITSLLMAGAVGAVLACAAENLRAESPAPPSSQVELPADFNPARSFAPLVEALQPAVVNVYVKQKVQVNNQAMNQDIWRHFFGAPFELPKQFEREGQGSGFIISSDGYVLTNNHVVEDADEVQVKLTDDTELEARVVGTDSRTDVALIKIQADHDLPFVALGVSRDLKVGDWVVAIGNPFGLAHTVTAGIVSAKGRSIGAGPYDDFIQTDASINPGNSGGPLFDITGKVVGINTAIIQHGQGIGFAVPIDMVTSILDELKTTGQVARGWIGVGLQELDEDLATALGVQGREGAVVREVYPDTPAQKAGLQAGDIITELDGQPIPDNETLIRAVGDKKPGEKGRLTLIRKGRKKNLSITLAERPDESLLGRGIYQAEPESGGRSGEPDLSTLARLGIQVQVARGLGMERGGSASGLVVTEVDEESPAEGKLRKGDVILEVNRVRVQTVDDLEKALSHSQSPILVLLERDGLQRFEAIPLED